MHMVTTVTAQILAGSQQEFTAYVAVMCQNSRCASWWHQSWLCMELAEQAQAWLCTQATGSCAHDDADPGWLRFMAAPQTPSKTCKLPAHADKVVCDDFCAWWHSGLIWLTMFSMMLKSCSLTAAVGIVFGGMQGKRGLTTFRRHS